MPSAWTLIDSSFPAYTGKERVRDQIPVILNYMYMLSEGLKYQLNNLSSKNWNSSALENLKIETTADLVEQLTGITEQLNTAANQLSSLTARLTQAESAVGELEKWQEETGEMLEDLDERLASAEGNILAMDDSLQTLEQVVKPDGTGGVSIGSDGKGVYLVGNIYVNGKLIS